MSRSRLTVNTAALRHNVAVWRSLLGPGAGLCGVVKAEGYGLGATAMARELRAAGVSVLAVYSPAQARRLIEEGDAGDLLILAPHLEPCGGLREPVLRAAHERLWLSVDAMETVEDLASLGLPLRLHPHVDTGMSRSGLDGSQVQGVIRRIMERGMRLHGVWTHMACADVDAATIEEQMARLGPVMAALPGGVVCHAANTHTAMRSRAYHLGMVRIGLGLLGYGAADLRGGPVLAGLEALRPVVRWSAPLVHVRGYASGARVGYGGECTLARPSVLGVVPVGYGDGYPVALSGVGSVKVRGMAVRVMGRVSMDQIVIDLTDVAGAGGGVGVGEEVTLYDDDPASPCYLPTLARGARTHVYELLCRLGPRVMRAWDNLA